MISPDEIRQKAERLYPKYVDAWLNGEAFFPRDVPFNKKLSDNIVEAAASRRALRAASFEEKGYGYRVTWVRRNSTKQGNNEFPERITFEAPSDLLTMIGKVDEFRLLAANVGRLRLEHPRLESWLLRSKNWKKLNRPTSEVDRLLAVVRYFCNNPRPNCYAREIPVEVDTKFIENHASILREWLDVLLPADAIRHDETKSFATRFYLKSVEPLQPVRVLCDELLRRSGLPFSDFGLRLSDLKSWRPPRCRVLIVENQTPFLTLPALPNTIAIGGLGNSAVVLRDVPWIVDQSVSYWGDLDVPGFEILNRFRRDVPGLQSVMMDLETLNRFSDRFAEPWTSGQPASGRLAAHDPFSMLDEFERQAVEKCRRDGLRLEQERIPLSFVNQMLLRHFS